VAEQEAATATTPEAKQFADAKVTELKQMLAKQEAARMLRKAQARQGAVSLIPIALSLIGFFIPGASGVANTIATVATKGLS
jgi:hypothetical protein